MAYRSLFPHEEELLLNKTLDFHHKDIIKILKKVKRNDKKQIKSAQLQISEVVAINQRAIIEDLAKIALEINRSTFEGLRTLSSEEMMNSDLTGAKKWIKANIEVFKELDFLPGQLQQERLKRIEVTARDYNRTFNTRISRMKNGEISKTDLRKMKDSLKVFKKPNKEVKALINNIDNYDNFTVEDIAKLQEWIKNRNQNWARNETGNLYADQTKEIMEKNGMDTYLWISERDSLVRPEHAGYDNGKPRNISDGIMPGEDWNCRCHAEPVNQK
ncbi:phage head morphogenesis protein [uncultured Ilyobacter sp.]|uniref:phage head morphogenesis protein n=1 Tax=uncultured Ilyobacter sp. TaxID=544433 RepID=UPI0029C78F55|nr:phage head morphogenesis protein [uncultured Ilyobacter sp.]